MLAAIGEKFNVEESIEYIELLLDAGADINIKRFDASPVTWAIREGYKELADFLKSKGGKEKF
jgi:ankyrin repeat protein